MKQDHIRPNMQRTSENFNKFSLISTILTWEPTIPKRNVVYEWGSKITPFPEGLFGIYSCFDDKPR